jgi:hypothetical protein
MGLSLLPPLYANRSNSFTNRAALRLTIECLDWLAQQELYLAALSGFGKREGSGLSVVGWGGCRRHPLLLRMDGRSINFLPWFN